VYGSASVAALEFAFLHVRTREIASVTARRSRFILLDAGSVIDASCPCRTLRSPLGALSFSGPGARTETAVTNGLPRIPGRGCTSCSADVYPDGAQRWSDATTWAGCIPASGSVVRIEAGRTIILDQDVDLGSLEIEGTLLVAPRDTTIRAGWICVHGDGRSPLATPNARSGSD